MNKRKITTIMKQPIPEKPINMELRIYVVPSNITLQEASKYEFHNSLVTQLNNFRGSKKIFILVSYVDTTYCYREFSVTDRFCMRDLKTLFLNITGNDEGTESTYCVLNSRNIYCNKNAEINKNSVLFFGFNGSIVGCTETLSGYKQKYVVSREELKKKREGITNIRNQELSKTILSLKPLYDGYIISKGGNDCYLNSVIFSCLIEILYGNYDIKYVIKCLEKLKSVYLETPAGIYFSTMTNFLNGNEVTSYSNFLLNYFINYNIIIYSSRYLIGNYVLTHQNNSVGEIGMTYKSEIEMIDQNFQKYLDNTVFKMGEIMEGSIINNALFAYILGTHTFFCANHYYEHTENRTIFEFKPTIISFKEESNFLPAISILLTGRHYNILVFNKDIRPEEKTNEKLEWYSKEILINNSSIKMTSAENAISNIRERRNVRNKNRMINEYIDNLPFSDIKKEYLKKIYLNQGNFSFWKEDTDQIAADFISLENELDRIQKMLYKDFKNMYGNVNEHKILELKKELISHTIDKTRLLPRRYKLYLKKYYKIIFNGRS